MSCVVQKGFKMTGNQWIYEPQGLSILIPSLTWMEQFWCTEKTHCIM